ncbi:MAG TPA: glycosyltransferase family 9 protein, partial [Humisphaera sp.]
MRVLACNPDTIGDLILRQPLYRALAAAGHELCLVVRASVEPAVPLVAPGARVVVLPREVYGGVDEHWADFAPAVAAAREFSPDLLLVAPYQWTRFEERLAEALRAELPSLRVVGMTGRLFAGDPHAGHAPASTLAFDQSAAVDEDLHEAEKNAALAAMLGAPVASVDPVITPDDASLEAARHILTERRLVPGKFAVACVTGTVHVPIKAWPEEKWAAALAEWHRRHGRRFLFVGLADERPAVDRVRGLMGDAAAGTAVWMEPGGSVGVLAALASLSAGYVGHDTGPMHVAAAVGKPVLAIFGGGHKLRFAPRVAPSVTLSVRVPCAGCGWVCSFETSHCVKELSVEQVLAAAADLEAGRVRTCEVRLQDLPAGVHERMTRFAADLARDRLRDLGDARTTFAAERDALSERAELAAREAEAVAAQARQTQQAMAALADESAGLVRQLAEREQTAAALRSAVDEANARTVAEAEGRRQDAELLRAETAAVRQQLEAARAEAEKARHDTDAAKKDLEILRAQQPPPPAAGPAPRVRKPLRERVVDLVCGQRHYTPRSVPPPMPKICVVTRVRPEDKDEDVRRTVESVLADRYPHLEYVLAAADADRPVVAEFAGRVAKVVPLGDQPFAGVAEAFARTDADVVCWLDTHFSLEPGALMRAGEYFRDHSLAMAVAFEQTVEKNGWRSTVGRPSLDVSSLRRGGFESFGQWVVLYRRQAYALLGPIDVAKGHAADWDLCVRFSRRFGIRTGRGHSVCEHVPPLAEPLAYPAQVAERADYKAALAAFETTFGLAGRIRCWLIARGGRIRWTAARWRSRLGRVRWDNEWYWYFGDVAAGRWSPRGAVPARVDADATPVAPVTHRRPDRLLF